MLSQSESLHVLWRRKVKDAFLSEILIVNVIQLQWWVPALYVSAETLIRQLAQSRVALFTLCGVSLADCILENVQIQEIGRRAAW